MKVFNKNMLKNRIMRDIFHAHRAESTRTLLKYILPLGFLFALALYCSNRAYLYSTVAFLQFCKEGNVALIFAMSCLLGLQAGSCIAALRMFMRNSHSEHLPGE